MGYLPQRGVGGAFFGGEVLYVFGAEAGVGGRPEIIWRDVRSKNETADIRC